MLNFYSLPAIFIYLHYPDRLPGTIVVEVLLITVTVDISCRAVDSIKTAVEKVLLQLKSDDPPLLITRKSRSVENILSSDACTSNAEASSRASSGKLPPALPCDVPAYSCHEASNAETPRHPGSGLSSAGSHTSLLDSPEIISVS